MKDLGNITEQELIRLILESVRAGLGGGFVSCEKILLGYERVISSHFPNLYDKTLAANTEPRWKNKARWVRKNMELDGVWQKSGKRGVWGKAD
jgi:hypothetical protein